MICIPTYTSRIVAIISGYSNESAALVFTIHGKRNGFEAAVKYGKYLNKNIELPFLGQIKIKNDNNDFIETLRNQITDCGISESTLFPDVEHLSKELSNEFSLKGKKGRIPEWVNRNQRT